jgi:hypothetical protein
MALSKLLACTVCAVTVFAAAGCADGTGKALTPTLPTVETTATNADGTLLKATTPRLASPQGSIRITNLTPTLRIANAAGTFDSSATLSYVFQVFEGATMIAESDPVAAASPETTWNVPANVLKLNRTYAWRARATYAGVVGSWTDPGAQFRTPLPPPVDGPVACGSSSGPAIIGCVASAYPTYLVSTAKGNGSLERRHHNMEFIRDRIIETGRCKGVNLGRNFKRGTPVISHDFIVLRRPGLKDAGVDIASGYDDVNKPLKLTWQVFGPDRNYGHPYYAGYPAVDCSNVQ